MLGSEFGVESCVLEHTKFELFVICSYCGNRKVGVGAFVKSKLLVFLWLVCVVFCVGEKSLLHNLHCESWCTYNTLASVGAF